MEIATTSPAQSDAQIRARIGPWADDAAADLGDFEMDTNFVVRAAAGSGKTTALVARMVALVRRGVDVRSTAAITFTRKAAAEMSERFYRELTRARRELPAGPEREAVTDALGNLQQSYVGTIDAFCSRILREYPLAVGLAPDFTSGIEEREEKELRAEALDAYLEKVYEESPETLEELDEMGVDVKRLPRFFDTLCAYPDLERYTDGPEQPPDMKEAVQTAAKLLKQCREQRPGPLIHGRDAAMKRFDRAAGMLRQAPFETPAEKAAFLEQFDRLLDKSNSGFTFKCWADRKDQPELYAAAKKLAKETYPQIVEREIRPVMRQWNACVHRAVTQLLGPAVDFYRELRRERGLLTYHDVLYFTRELLRDHPPIRARIQKRYGRFLVDEFQDTDPLQTQILFYLTGSDTSEADWRQCRPRPGSLFIVGDDKQSIYRFRRADRQLFDEVAGFVGDAGGEVVDLTRNFRSLGALCEWCNDAFGEVFCHPEIESIQADYVPFQAHRPMGNDAHGVRRIEIPDVHRNRAEQIAGADAEKIAQFIRSACDGHCDELTGEQGAVFSERARYDDFLILTRNTKRLDIYAEALAASGIPYTITGSRDLGQSYEFRALVQLLTCAMRPDDPVAAAAYFRGGLCGFSDDDLYRYHRAGGAFEAMFEPLSDDAFRAMDPALAGRFGTALERVREARTLLSTERPTLAIEKLVEGTGLMAGAVHPDADEAGMQEASLRAGKLLRALIYVRKLAGKGMDWAEIVEELRLVAEGEEKIDGMTLETGSGGAVRIMNVHQAKGLEAPVVFLADPYSSGSSNGPEKHIARDEGALVAPLIKGESHYTSMTHAPVGWYDPPAGAAAAESEGNAGFGYESLEAQHERAEEQRLLYVAATRAKNLLVISTYPKKSDDGYWSDLYAHLDRADVPPLQIPDSGHMEIAQAPAPDMMADRTLRETKIGEISRESYMLQTVTGRKKEEEATSSRRFSAEGYGAEVGVALHLLVELLAQHRISGSELDTVPFAALAAREKLELSDDDLDRVRTMARRLLESDLWDEVLAADELYTEYPLMVSSEGTPPVLTRGVVDLLYRSDGAWHLVDVKSDRIDDTSVLHALPEDHGYLQQVRRYTAAWESAAGQPIASAGLWFADAGEYVEVN